ncbi:MAG: DNA topoisomerase [Candidatus Brocadiia bacterium]
MPLLIVESPTKVKTLARILKGDWDFAVTRGHLYDLPEDEMGIDEDYQPNWSPLKGASVGSIRQAAKGQKEIYVASDPDREGEAIAWQVENLVLKRKDTRRVRLESLTKEEVQEQLAQKGQTDQSLVQAQWARRVLDRLAGYKISPFLIKAFKGKRLSAGRVQSAVLAKIVERWDAVEDFEPEAFFNLQVQLQPEKGTLEEPLLVKLVRIDGDTIGTGDEDKLLKDRELADSLFEAIDNNGLILQDREEKLTRSKPGFPFDSSEMLRRASSWFGWPAKKTMKVAQALYEKGLITYHRSDSTRLSKSACKQAAVFVKKEYGEEFHQWRGGGGGDQEGHEAIRSKSPFLKPDDLHSVSRDQFTLYSAIWQRYVQSQMKLAEWNTLKFEFKIPDIDGDVVFQSTEKTIKEWGFFRCQRPGETPIPERERSAADFEQLKKSGDYRVVETELEESKTRGPSLYTEGSLIAMMKQEGIGRPSTYAATIERLRSREYIRDEGKYVEPTSRGRDVCRFLKRSVPAICTVELTESMERTLDKIAAGEEDWQGFVRGFDEDLESWLEKGKGVEPEGTAEGFKEELDFEVCPRCGSKLVLRKGRYGMFVHCTAEDCDFSSNPPAKTYICPKCGRHMVKKKGKKSTVYHCIAAPECDGKRPVGKPNMTYEEFQKNAPKCPECGAPMDRRKGRYGYFWGCTKYPKCKGTVSIS